MTKWTCRHGSTRLVNYVVATLGVVLLVATLTPQAQSVSAGSYTAPRTGWGDPDIQGVWTNATLTPVPKIPLVEEPTQALSEAIRNSIIIFFFN